MCVQIHFKVSHESIMCDYKYRIFHKAWLFSKAKRISEESSYVLLFSKSFECLA